MQIKRVNKLLESVKRELRESQDPEFAELMRAANNQFHGKDVKPPALASVGQKLGWKFSSMPHDFPDSEKGADWDEYRRMVKVGVTTPGGKHATMSVLSSAYDDGHSWDAGYSFGGDGAVYNSSCSQVSRQPWHG